jgi:hypothetical protein
MPRRIVGHARFGLYAALTPETKRIFDQLFAVLIYRVAAREERGCFCPRGYDDTWEQQRGWRLDARLVLGDDFICVNATRLSRDEIDHDDDGRDDLQDICTLEFIEEDGKFRLKQTSGAPLPRPVTVHRTPAEHQPKSKTTGMRDLIRAKTHEHLSRLADSYKFFIQKSLAADLRHRPSRSTKPIADRIASSLEQSRGVDQASPAISAPNNHSPAKLIYRTIWQIAKQIAFIGASPALLSTSEINSIIRAAIVLARNDRILKTIFSRYGMNCGLVSKVIADSLNRSHSDAAYIFRFMATIGKQESKDIKLGRKEARLWNRYIRRPLKDALEREIPKKVHRSKTIGGRRSQSPPLERANHRRSSSRAIDRAAPRDKPLF